MRGGPLTIRNITPTQLEIKIVEHFEPQGQINNANFITRNLGILRSSYSSAAAEPLLNFRSTGRWRQDVKIPMFGTVQTGVASPSCARSDVHRLTFEVAGELHSLDIAWTSPKYQTLTTASAEPKHQFAGIFMPEYAFLAIFSNSKPHCWMKYLQDETSLSSLSIPGTHNSATCHTALPSVRCQSVSPRVQLENGVRFFDVRVQVDTSSSPRLTLVHGAFPVSLAGPKYFQTLLQDVFAFLDSNPSETVVMSVKREGIGDWNGEQLSRVLSDHYTGTEKHRWYTDSKIPMLAQVRGKITLMRRFVIGDQLRKLHDGGYGIDAECWQDNTAHCEYGNVCVQDFYEVLEVVDIEKKLDLCRAQFERAAKCITSSRDMTTIKALPMSPHPLHLNFLSASNFWRMGCWPHKVAASVNPAIIDWLCRKHAQDTGGNGSTGIVICDWVGASGDWSLVCAIFGFNSMLLAPDINRER